VGGGGISRGLNSTRVWVWVTGQTGIRKSMPIHGFPNPCLSGHPRPCPSTGISALAAEL